MATSPKFTARHYNVIAEAIRKARYISADSPTVTYQHSLNLLTLILAEDFILDNPLFDSDRFLEACEYAKLPRIDEVVQI